MKGNILPELSSFVLLWFYCFFFSLHPQFKMIFSYLCVYIVYGVFLMFSIIKKKRRCFLATILDFIDLSYFLICNAGIFLQG